MIELRSDTLTKPSKEMRREMAAAEVGDDTFGEDPTINRLEELTAELLGVEAALFVTSGTQGNQLCLRVHGRAGDCIVAHEFSHIYEYETGAPAALSGLATRFIHTDDGTFTVDDIMPHLRAPNIHASRDRILALENTHNRCGGVVWDYERYCTVCAFGRERGMAVHLDGARLWNAAAASGVALGNWAREVDSLSVCFSKGLGAPVGSAVCGSRELIEEARFYRKMFGGQMRQAGIIAAGALYALEHNLGRLVEDHANCRLLYDGLKELPGLRCIPPLTNILIAEVTIPGMGSQRVMEELAAEGVAFFTMSDRNIRLVTHLDVTTEECRRAVEAFERVMPHLAAS